MSVPSKNRRSDINSEGERDSLTKKEADAEVRREGGAGEDEVGLGRRRVETAEDEEL